MKDSGKTLKRIECNQIKEYLKFITKIKFKLMKYNTIQSFIHLTILTKMNYVSN